MKKTVSIILLICMLLSCVACGQKGTTEAVPTWQEQYDLGVRYLSEGNYEEAILAFTAAIEIDPKKADAYLGRGDAYMGSGETKDNLAAALTDYQAVLELDATCSIAYLSIANIFIQQGNYSDALDILQQGVLKANDTSELESKADEIKASQRYVTVRTMKSDGVGGPWAYGINEYNLWDELIFATLYNSNDTIDEYWGWELDDAGRVIKYLCYDSAHQLKGYTTFEYSENGEVLRETNYDADGNIH